MLTALKDELDGGRMYWFSGPVPTSADDALDMVNDHTQLVMMTESGDGSTGLTFAVPAGTAMLKNAGETWSGLIAFDGAEDSETTLTATFYRFCAAGDNGRGAASSARIQGTIGAPGSNIPMTSAALTANTVNTQGLSYFAVIEDSV
ncbi:MAG TPA: hypothetical protein PK177_09255 [Burkholderiaceae bacterium]|nr:hypothetical protein [Burkholderiaceae bacterium]